MKLRKNFQKKNIAAELGIDEHRNKKEKYRLEGAGRISESMN